VERLKVFGLDVLNFGQKAFSRAGVLVVFQKNYNNNKKKLGRRRRNKKKQYRVLF
jgi:hypothetical protein